MFGEQKRSADSVNTPPRETAVEQERLAPPTHADIHQYFTLAYLEDGEDERTAEQTRELKDLKKRLHAFMEGPELHLALEGALPQTVEVLRASLTALKQELIDANKAYFPSNTPEKIRLSNSSLLNTAERDSFLRMSVLQPLLDRGFALETDAYAEVSKTGAIVLDIEPYRKVGDGLATAAHIRLLFQDYKRQLTAAA